MAELTAADIATLTGLTTAQQSYWRRRGAMDGLGTKGRRWLYTTAEALAIYVMVRLFDAGLAMDAARRLTDILFSHAAEFSERTGDFILAYPGDGEDWRVTDIKDAMQDFGIAGLVVDFRTIMDEAPPSLIDGMNQTEKV